MYHSIADAQNDHQNDAVPPHILLGPSRLVDVKTLEEPLVVKKTLVTSASPSPSPSPPLQSASPGVAAAMAIGTSAIFTQTESTGEFISSSPSSNFVNFESTVKSSAKSTSSTSPSPFSPLHTASASDHLQADQPWFRCPPEATSTGKGCQLTAFPSSDPSTGE